MSDTVISVAPPKTLVGVGTSLVESNSRFALAMIILLVVTIIAMYVYYHGIFSFGPYCDKKDKKDKKDKSKNKEKEKDKSDKKSDDKTEEAELIDKINSVSDSK